MLKKRLYIALAALAALLVINSVDLFLPDREEAQIAENKPAVARELSNEEYLGVVREFTAMSDEHDPKFALTELRTRIKTDETLLRKCHSIVHEIGHEAYEKYEDFGEAMKYQDEICNSGYLHGIIESHFLKVPDVFAAMETVCEPYPAGKFISWECYHGIGHGVMYYLSNDLPKSVAMCETYDSTFARENCINGVFMENFNADQKLHVSKYLKESDPMFPCAAQKPEHQAICFMYAPTYYLSLNKNAYAAALDWCAGAGFYESACAGGVGSQAIKDNIENPKLVESMCMKGKSSQAQPCISGMVGLYINHYGSLEPAKELCPKLEADNRSTCERTIAASASLF